MRLIIAFFALSVVSAATAEPLLLQRPTLNETHIVFVYAGDLWSVPREGGDAVRLTNGTEPQGIFGPKAMIINERARSGGDAMPWYFKPRRG